jgi:diaminopimelate epimerase
MVGAMTMRLHKLHATGNDFLVSVALDGHPPPDAAVARALCERHRGIGADGVITVLAGRDGSDCTMVLRNADGGEAEMSGNGIRCLAWVAVREGLGDGGRLVVDTAGGRRVVDTERGADGQVCRAIVDMGAATFEPSEIPLESPSAFDLEVTCGESAYHGDAVGMGNPHFVLLVDDVDTARVTEHGPLIERDARFPNRTNVEFVAPVGTDHLRLRVWERGVGETQSCGTGACATAVVAQRRGLVGDRVLVHVPGGVLSVELGAAIRLGGPVVHVFDVEVDPDGLEHGS